MFSSFNLDLRLVQRGTRIRFLQMAKTQLDTDDVAGITISMKLSLFPISKKESAKKFLPFRIVGNISIAIMSAINI